MDRKLRPREALGLAPDHPPGIVGVVDCQAFLLDHQLACITTGISLVRESLSVLLCNMHEESCVVQRQ